MTKKMLIALLIVCMAVLSACGGDSGGKSTVPTESDTTTTTTTTTSVPWGNSQALPSGGDAVALNLNDTFRGKFGSFKVSTSWTFANAGINTPNDTSYFYFGAQGELPFLMYQYEVAKTGRDLTEDEWNSIVANVGGKRISDKEINGRKFIRILAENQNPPLKFVLYYTYEKDVLQGLMMVYPQTETEDEKYIQILEQIVETFEVGDIERGLQTMELEGTSSASAAMPTSSAPLSGDAAQLPDGYAAVDVEGGKLPLPEGYLEHSVTDTPMYTVGFSNPSAQGRSIVYQYGDMSELMKNATEDQISRFIDVYLRGMGAAKSEIQTLNGREFIVFENEINPKAVGYLSFDPETKTIRTVMMMIYNATDDDIAKGRSTVQTMFEYFVWE